MVRGPEVVHELARVVAGSHRTPHDVLGPHRVEGGWVVRVWRPGADTCALRTSGGDRISMARVHEAGIFVADLASDPGAYQVDVSYPGGWTATADDPYRFWPTLGDVDLHLIGEGTHQRLWAVLGAHHRQHDGALGTAFAVWAPSAKSVRIVGDFNSWDGRAHPMRIMGSSGVWELFVPGAGPGQHYKFEVNGSTGRVALKADPLARAAELPPGAASIITASHHQWNDAEWLERREREDPVNRPLTIYEMHLGSWRQGLGYRELAVQLADHMTDLGFTHVELLPVAEHPFGGSWGYQVSSYYAPTARYGSPDDFRWFVDHLHQRGIGVIVDWVPAHFPRDEWALGRFDGTALYEHLDPRLGEHPDWGTFVFNYARNEVRNFLVANALYWVDEFHIDGLRVDAVASMVYLDYSRKPGQWLPNERGGRENLGALEFIRDLNVTLHGAHPGVLTIAEESTSWPAVTAPVHHGGLGFTHKWNMGWMHDTLDYLRHDPVHRKHHHRNLTFGLLYAYTENFVLPLSHDEVVHGKGPLIDKMAGDEWQKFANLRALYGWMYAYPGRKLLFMGSEIGQTREWHHDRSLDWWLLDWPPHAGVRDLVRELNAAVVSEPALWEMDREPAGFRWLDADDAEHSVYSFVRFSEDGRRAVACVANFTPVPREGYRLGLPYPGSWKTLLDTNTRWFWGTGYGGVAGIETEPVAWHGYGDSAVVTLPPLAVVWFAGEVVPRRGAHRTIHGAMSERWLVIHGHFYQPPRENPWTETVPVEPSAAPDHDWNERITEEAYRPNAFARIMDDHGSLVALVDNYRLMSFNVGPTLLSWLELHHDDVYGAIVRAGRESRGAIAQGYSHLILPLASRRDMTTQVRWGLADFAHRFGRRAEGMWLPETAVNDEVLEVLAEEGVGFTILAPGQAVRVRPMAAGDNGEREWTSVDDGSIDTRRTYRWCHPSGDGRGVTIVFYEGSLSHEVAFGLGSLSSAALVERAEHLLSDSDKGGVVCVATDGETFGHHHRWGERAVAYALAVEAPRHGLATGGLADVALDRTPEWEVEVKESAWSCPHGVGRWKEDCGCHTGGGPGWHQQWRAPLRAAFDRLRDHGIEVFDRRGYAVLHDPWAARDAYVDVVLGALSIDEFAARWVRDESPDATIEALTLLEAQRHAMLMYTSCGWFFNDIAGIETVQVMRYAARAADLLDELGEGPDLGEMLEILDAAVSNDPSEGTGRDIWRRHVEPTRVGASRVVAHLAMIDLLERSEPPSSLGGYDVIVQRHDHGDRGSVEMCSGRVELRHRRTRRRHEHVYAALRMGALEIAGATRPTGGEVGADDELLAAFGRAFREGERVSALVRRMVDDLAPGHRGGEEFGLDSALPDAADQVLRSTAQSLADRFDIVFERLVTDASDTFEALTLAGYPLPPELKVPMQMAWARRLETDLVALARGYSALTHRSARELAEQARVQGLDLMTPDVVAALRAATLRAVTTAVEERHLTAVEPAIAMVRLALLLDPRFDLSRSQDQIYFALVGARDESAAALRPLGVVLGLSVDALGIPRPAQ